MEEFSQHCPTNNSKAKAMYSIPKATRITWEVPRPLYLTLYSSYYYRCDNFYDIRRPPTAEIKHAPKFA